MRCWISSSSVLYVIASFPTFFLTKVFFFLKCFTVPPLLSHFDVTISKRKSYSRIKTEQPLTMFIILVSILSAFSNFVVLCVAQQIERYLLSYCCYASLLLALLFQSDETSNVTAALCSATHIRTKIAGALGEAHTVLTP